LSEIQTVPTFDEVKARILLIDKGNKEREEKLKAQMQLADVSAGGNAAAEVAIRRAAVMSAIQSNSRLRLFSC
jgi:hypothetical protein